MAFKLTDSRTDDRACVDDLTKDLAGKIVGDKGYIKKALSESLFARGLKLITRIRKNMKAKFIMSLVKDTDFRLIFIPRC